MCDEKTIAKLTRHAALPLNILAGPGCPPALRLQELGVARVSVGSGPARASLALTERIARELRGPGTFGYLDGAMPYAEANRIFRKRGSTLTSARAAAS